MFLKKKSSVLYIVVKKPVSIVFASMFLILLVGCHQTGYKMLDNTMASIPDENGWVLINFWAEWCHPCLEEIPEINKISKQLPGSLVAVYGIYFDPITPEQLKLTLTKHQVEFINFSPEELNLPVAIPSMLPANYLINSDGNIIGPLLGPQTMQSILKVISENTS